MMTNGGRFRCNNTLWVCRPKGDHAVSDRASQGDASIVAAQNDLEEVVDGYGHLDERDKKIIRSAITALLISHQKTARVVSFSCAPQRWQRIQPGVKRIRHLLR